MPIKPTPTSPIRTISCISLFILALRPSAVSSVWGGIGRILSFGGYLFRFRTAKIPQPTRLRGVRAVVILGGFLPASFRPRLGLRGLAVRVEPRVLGVLRGRPQEL